MCSSAHASAGNRESWNAARQGPTEHEFAGHDLVVRRLLQRMGVDVVPFRAARHPLARRLHLFQRYSVSRVLDVGANSGQYGRFLRRIGYQGRIISFEPLSSAFAALKVAAHGDPSWEVRNVALGDRPGTLTLNVSENSESSSILSMLPAHLAAHPASRYVGTEAVSVTTLAEVLTHLPDSLGTFVKVDAQGYERNIIVGGDGFLDRVCGVQLEMSLQAFPTR